MKAFSSYLEVRVRNVAGKMGPESISEEVKKCAKTQRMCDRQRDDERWMNGGEGMRGISYYCMWQQTLESWLD